MRVIFEHESGVAADTTWEGQHFTIPQGKIWRLDKLTFVNQTGARGNFALLCVTGGATNYLIPFTPMSTDRKVIDLQGVYLSEADEIYAYIEGLTIGDTIAYSFRGFEKDLVGVDFII
jgi:hypothetical protein